jgi:hypothetical protein
VPRLARLTAPTEAAGAQLARTNDAHIHAVLYREQQTIHLIGYASESEVVRAARSLRRVTAE